MTRESYDLLIVGSGSAAFAAGIRARDLGATVALCESGTIGGTCVNVGCVPSKAMLAAADLYHRAGHSPFPGVATSSGSLDLATLVGAKDELVTHMRAEKYEQLAEEYGFVVLRGRGRFTGPAVFECDGREVRAGQFLVATGASPSVPPIPGLEAAGYQVDVTSEGLCCGLTWVSTGQLDVARRIMQRTVNKLDVPHDDRPIVVLEPSCGAALRTDLKAWRPQHV